jgi:hypothetical protein
VSGSDSGVGTDDGTVVDLTVPTPPDTGGGRDVDFGDETSIYGEPPRHLSDSDSAVSLEVGRVVDITPPPKPPRIRIKLPRRREPEPAEVFRALTDATVRWRRRIRRTSRRWRRWTRAVAWRAWGTCRT